MDAKYNGEVKTRKILSSGNTDYVIVRPGVLLNGKTATGPAGLELNQGDTIGGGLSREWLESRGSESQKASACYSRGPRKFQSHYSHTGGLTINERTP